MGQESTGCHTESHTDSPSHRNTRGINNSHPQSPCSPLQPANSTITFTLIPSSGCSAPSIALDAPNRKRVSVSPGITSNQGCENDSQATAPGCSQLLPPSQHSHCPQPAPGSAAAHTISGQHKPSLPAAPHGGSPHACSAVPAALSFSLLKNYVA